MDQGHFSLESVIDRPYKVCHAVSLPKSEKKWSDFEVKLPDYSCFCVTWLLKCTYSLGPGGLWLAIPEHRGGAVKYILFCAHSPLPFVHLLRLARGSTHKQTLKSWWSNAGNMQMYFIPAVHPGDDPFLKQDAPRVVNTNRCAPGFDRGGQNHLADIHCWCSRE